MKIAILWSLVSQDWVMVERVTKVRFKCGYLEVAVLMYYYQEAVTIVT